MSHHQLEKVSCSRQFDFVPNHFRGTFLCSFEAIPTMPWVPEAFSLRKIREWTCGARIFKNKVLSLIQLPFSNTSLTFTIHWPKFLISFLRTCIGSMDSNIIWSSFDIVWSFFPYPLGCSVFLQHLNIFWKKKNTWKWFQHHFDRTPCQDPVRTGLPTTTNPKIQSNFQISHFVKYWKTFQPSKTSGGCTLGISGKGCAAGTLESLTYTRASSAKFCYPILR